MRRYLFVLMNQRYPTTPSNAARKPGSDPSSVASLTQYDMRKWPGPPNPVPGTTRTRFSLSMSVNFTSSSMGAFGNM